MLTRVIRYIYVFMQHTVKDLPALNLPDVCTETPAYGQAFCQEDCDFLSQQAPDVPTALRDFLRFYGAQKEGITTSEHKHPVGC